MGKLSGKPVSHRYLVRTKTELTRFLLDTSDSIFLGEWNGSSNPARVLSIGHKGSPDGDRWDLRRAVNVQLATDGGSNWHEDFNDNGETHVRGNLNGQNNAQR